MVLKTPGGVVDVEGMAVMSLPFGTDRQTGLATVHDLLVSEAELDWQVPWYGRSGPLRDRSGGHS